MATGWLYVFEKAEESLPFWPPHMFPSHLTGLPGFCIQAPIFSVGKIVENTFFI